MALAFCRNCFGSFTTSRSCGRAYLKPPDTVPPHSWSLGTARSSRLSLRDMWLRLGTPFCRCLAAQWWVLGAATWPTAGAWTWPRASCAWPSSSSSRVEAKAVSRRTRVCGVVVRAEAAIRGHVHGQAVEAGRVDTQGCGYDGSHKRTRSSGITCSAPPHTSDCSSSFPAWRCSFFVLLLCWCGCLTAACIAGASGACRRLVLSLAEDWRHRGGLRRRFHREC